MKQECDLRIKNRGGNNARGKKDLSELPERNGTSI